jgi:hypothetical protein
LTDLDLPAGSSRKLYGRRGECKLLDGLLEQVRGGHSMVMVVLGEAGVGKTALLEHVLESAADLRVARAAGVESEMELAFAGLHQLCGPMLDHFDRLRVRSERRWGQRSAWRRGRRRTGSCWDWPC